MLLVCTTGGGGTLQRQTVFPAAPTGAPERDGRLVHQSAEQAAPAAALGATVEDTTPQGEPQRGGHLIQQSSSSPGWVWCSVWVPLRNWHFNIMLKTVCVETCVSVAQYAPCSARMNPENVHKLMGFHMEV